MVKKCNKNKSPVRSSTNGNIKNKNNMFYRLYKQNNYVINKTSKRDEKFN